MSDLSLEIYHLDVQGGDSTAILVKDLEKGRETIYSILIDAGAEGKGSAYLKTYLKKHKMESFDCIIATHYHQDHIQGFKSADIKFKSFIDNGAYVDKWGHVFAPRNDIGKGARTIVFDAYRDQVQLQMGENVAERIAIPFIEKNFNLKTAKPLELELGKGTGIKLTCYCANGILANGTDLLGAQKRKKNKDISPNDVSLAFVLEWGDFRYLTAGDLSGDRDLSSYYNIEEGLVNYLTAGPLRGKSVTVFKASHHGSEHSNHQDLLNKFKPDTIIVCCNIIKQVPSPIFLDRLATYFKTNKKATAVFTNKLKVFKNDDRYTVLNSIKNYIADGNLEFAGDDDEEQVASNLAIKCAIIRRRVLNGMQTEYDDMELDGTTVISKTGYDIVLMAREANEKDTLEASVKFTSYDIKRSWTKQELSYNTIQEGFMKQAEAMAGWVEADKMLEDQLGKDYILEHYPGLMKSITDSKKDKVKSALFNEMERMFDNSFILQWNDFYAKKTENHLTSDEKRTFHALMVNNSYQPDFNRVNKYFNYPKSRSYKFDSKRAWNVLDFPEPTASVGTAKRPAEVADLKEPKGRPNKLRK